MCVLHAEDRGQPQSSILTMHPETGFLVIFHCACQASWPRSFQGFSGAQRLHTLNALQVLRIQTQALTFAQQVL